MKIGKTYDKVYDLISGYFPGWLIVIMMCLVLIEVITRYVTRHPLGAADEISGILMVMITFMGLGYTWKQRRHIRLSFAVERLPARVAKWLRVIVLAGILAFLGILTLSCYNLVVHAWQYGERSFDIGIPLAGPQMFMLIGSALLFIGVLVDFLKGVKAIISGIGGEI